MKKWKNYQTLAAVSWGYDVVNDAVLNEIMATSENPHSRAIRLEHILITQFEKDMQSISDQVEKLNSSFYADLLSYTAGQIDWYAIAASIVEDQTAEEED